MTAVSSPPVVELFKKVYGDHKDLTPNDQILSKDIPWQEGQKVGDEFIESVTLTDEVGITLGGSGTDAFEIDAAVAGATKQVKVSPYVSVLPSILPWAVISRSAGAGDGEGKGNEKAFFDATKRIVKNNLKSHEKLKETLRLYGQATAKLGYVSYATATYRGVSFTNGGGALTHKGTSVTYTAGVNTTSKHILFAPGNFAAGHWVGRKGLRVEQILTSSGAVVASGSLVSVDAGNGSIEVDFTPVAATSTTSHHIGIKGMADTGEMIGIQKILSTTGTLFNVNNSIYELFKGTEHNCAATKFSFTHFQNGVSKAVNQGGLEGDIVVYVNPRSWATLTSTEASARDYDDSYDPKKAEQGFKDIIYYTQTGRAVIKAHRHVKEGEAFGLHLDDWSRSGSSEVSFSVPGMKEDIIFPLQNQAGYAFRSFSDEFVLCVAPARSIYWYGINDESAS